MRAAWTAAVILAAAGGCADPQPCPTPLEACGGVCYDLRSDRLNCGGCGVSCGVGLACLAGACVDDPAASCPARTGGAFVTLERCGQVVKAWVTAEPFVDRAELLAADPQAGGASVPRLDLRAGADCDAQWSWHVEPGTASFLELAPAGCDACPGQVEADLGSWLQAGAWCPAGARVLAVERR